MIEEKQVGSIAANGKFYTPKYWVAKLKKESDVLIKTADKSLLTSRDLFEELYPQHSNEDVLFISIQISNVPEFIEDDKPF